jgi:c(7)-type cytochrome triheme protein
MSKRLSIPLGFAAALGLIGAVGVLAGDSKEVAPAAPTAEVLQSWGDTEAILEEPAGEMFSHKAHVVSSGLDCDSCHPDPFEEKRGAAEANGDYTMAALEEGKYCGICHDGDTAFGVTDPKDCVTCHGSDMKQPKTILFTEPVKAVIFNHELHVEDFGFECSECHNKLFKMKMGNAEKHAEEFTMEALYAGKYCGACHNGDDAFASDTKCTVCHIGSIGFRHLAGEAESGEKKGHH